jgi:hypothetical protein
LMTRAALFVTDLAASMYSISVQTGGKQRALLLSLFLIFVSVGHVDGSIFTRDSAEFEQEPLCIAVDWDISSDQDDYVDGALVVYTDHPQTADESRTPGVLHFTPLGGSTSGTTSSSSSSTVANGVMAAVFCVVLQFGARPWSWVCGERSSHLPNPPTGDLLRPPRSA